MPLSRIVCPHCEQNVELNITTVTRSRDCPNCGKAIMLQFTTKEKRTKRKALLMPHADLLENLEEHADLAHITPRGLGEDFHGRLLHDPDVQRNLKQLIIGSTVVATLIVLLILANRFHWWRSLDEGLTSVRMSVAKPSAIPEPTVDGPPALPTPSEGGAQRPPTITTPVRVNPVAPPRSTPRPVPGTPMTATTERDKAARVLSDFLNAGSVDERLALVRDRARMEPKIRAYYATHPDGPIACERLVMPEAGDDAAAIFSIKVIFPDGQPRTAWVGKGSDGRYYVDWASFVAYSEMRWEDFVQQRPTTPVLMRVLVEEGEHFGSIFTDSNRFLCVKVTNPIQPAGPPIFAYAPRNSPAARSVEFVLRTASTRPSPVILTLKHPSAADNTEANQVWIEQLVAEGWIAQGR